MIRKTLMLAGLAGALLLAGCGTTVVNPNDTKVGNAPGIVYNIGATEVALLHFAAVLPTPGKLCGPIKALNEGWFVEARIVSDPGYNGDFWKSQADHLNDLLGAAVKAAMELGFSFLAPKPKLGTISQQEWADLMSNVQTGLNKLNCV
jgi:hypothetical protein